MANIFPRWSNLLPLKIAICLACVAGGVSLAFTYYATPKAMVVGYQPSQPIPFSHKIHVDQVGLDCRYCHSFADVAGHSNVPSGNTCWNCHQHVQRDSPKLEPLHRSMNPSHPQYDGKPIEWVRVHKAPDYVYFNHSAHLNRGISCQTCHGDVDQMEVVYQAQPHSMAGASSATATPRSSCAPSRRSSTSSMTPRLTWPRTRCRA
ncbi:MAG TPA: cytochrome c3 family protein [Luteolibacter sp.]|nr:cytochrome c3 family protein [Luteolibacter sp.]